MASVDDVLAALGAASEDYDYDYVIDNDLRTVAVPSLGVVIGVVGDKLVNTVRFRMPRYYRGCDLSDGFVPRINHVNAGGEAAYTLATDVEAGEDSIEFSWPVDAAVCAYEGTVSFVVRLVKADGELNIAQAYDTTIGTASCLEGIAADASITPEEQADVLAAIKAAQDAAASAAECATAADNAAGAARAAETDAAGAAKKANEAATAATGAAGTANTAATSALGAAETAEAAATSATEAAATADTAASAATEAASKLGDYYFKAEADGIHVYMRED